MLDISLHPKQMLALTTPANEILYGGAVGGGKALHVDTAILTYNGWKTMGTIQVGDQVFDEQGNMCNVLMKSPVYEDHVTYKVTFDINKTIICDADHEWPTIKGIKKTKDLQKGDHIPLTKPLQMPERELPIHPYIMGAFLAGDGVQDIKARAGMTLSTRCIKAGIHLPTFEGGKYYRKDSWYALLDGLGLKDIDKYEKFIPHIYKMSSEAQRRELLAGFMDVSGTVFTAAYSYKGATLGQTEIFAPNERLNNGIFDLFASLGERPRKYKREAENAIRRSRCKYRVRCYCHQNFFKSKDRRIRAGKVLKAKKALQERVCFFKTEKIDSQPLQCIQVDSPSHCYLAGENLIPTHNSHLMRAAAILWAMQCPGIQIYLFRLTRKEIIDNHMVGTGGFYELLADAVNSRFVKINNTDHYIAFRNGDHNSFFTGSRIHLCHCQHEDDKYLYQGAQMGVLMIDEATHFSKSKYEYLRTRVRIPETWSVPSEFTAVWGENFFPRILLASNPGGLSFSYFRSEFVKLASPFTIVKMPDTKGGMLRQYIPASLDDNPSINKIEYAGKIMGVGNEAVARMLLEGDWDAIAGGMFDDVWDETLHMIEPFEIPESWYVDRSMDWGYTDPFSVGWWAQSDGSEVTMPDGTIVAFPTNTIFRIAEWYGCAGEDNVGMQLTGYEIGVGIRNRERDDPVLKNVKKVYPGPADSQMWNNSPKHDSVYRSTIQEINSAYYVNDSYKMFDIFTRADKTYGSRVRGWNMLRTHLKNTLKFPNVDRECIYFFKSCPTVNRVMPITIRHDSKIEDIADGQEDHILDEIRYRVQHTVQRMRKVKTRVG